MDRREAPLVVVGGVELALVLHHGGKRQRLAAGAGAEIEHLLAGLGAGKQRGKLRAFVLHLDHAFQEGRLGMDRRALGVGGKTDAQAPRRPARGLGAQVRQHGGGLVALSLQRIDAQVERRARGQRRALLRARVSEGARQMRVEPFRIIAGDMRRRAVRSAGIETSALVFAQRLGRILRAVGELARSPRVSSPRSRLSMPSRTARGVSAPMSQALEARRRSAS